MMRFSFFVAAGIAMLGSVGAARQPVPEPGAAAPQPAPAADAALMKELAEIDARSAKIEDLTAEFEQEKFTALLKKPLVSGGKVRMLPPRTRWDTERPHKSVLLLDEHELKIYDPEAVTLEIYDVAGGLGRMTASPVPRLSEIKDQFTISRIDPTTMDDKATADGFVALRLTPTDGQIKEHVSEVRVLIDRALACASRVEVTDADGDRTVIRFKNLRLNTGLRAADLDLAVPAGTAVSHPFEGAGPPPAPGEPKP